MATWTPTDLDPSLAFTALLEASPDGFGKEDYRETDRIISLFLSDFYDANEANMYAYARHWATGYYNS